MKAKVTIICFSLFVTTFLFFFQAPFAGAEEINGGQVTIKGEITFTEESQSDGKLPQSNEKNPWVWTLSGVALLIFFLMIILGSKRKEVLDP